MNRLFEPKDIAPMACAEVDSVDQLPGNFEDYVLEVKYDGFRLMACVMEDRVDFMTRGLKWQDGKLPYIEKELLSLFPAGTVLDGEVVAMRNATPEEFAEGKPAFINDFEHVQSVMLSLPAEAVLKAGLVRPLRYMVFDMLHVPAGPITGEPHFARRHLLESYFGEYSSNTLQLSPCVEAFQVHHDDWVAAGCEGTVAKRKDSKYYVGKRPKGAWYKIKATWTMDAIIVGFVPGRGKNKGKVGSIVFAQPTEDLDHISDSAKEIAKLDKMYSNELAKGKTSRGMFWGWNRLDGHYGIAISRLAIRGCARGFKDSIMNDMSSFPEGYIGQVVEISHNGLMAGGTKVRHPQFLRFRNDKGIDDVDWRHR